MNQTQFEILVKRMIGLRTPKAAGLHCTVATLACLEMPVKI